MVRMSKRKPNNALPQRAHAGRQERGKKAQEWGKWRQIYCPRSFGFSDLFAFASCLCSAYVCVFVLIALCANLCVCVYICVCSNYRFDRSFLEGCSARHSGARVLVIGNSLEQRLHGWVNSGRVAPLGEVAFHGACCSLENMYNALQLGLNPAAPFDFVFFEYVLHDSRDGCAVFEHIKLPYMEHIIDDALLRPFPERTAFVNKSNPHYKENEFIFPPANQKTKLFRQTGSFVQVRQTITPHEKAAFFHSLFAVVVCFLRFLIVGLFFLFRLFSFFCCCFVLGPMLLLLLFDWCSGIWLPIPLSAHTHTHTHTHKQRVAVQRRTGSIAPPFNRRQKLLGTSTAATLSSLRVLFAFFFFCFSLFVFVVIVCVLFSWHFTRFLTNSARVYWMNQLAETMSEKKGSYFPLVGRFQPMAALSVYKADANDNVHYQDGVSMLQWVMMQNAMCADAIGTVTPGSDPFNTNNFAHAPFNGVKGH